MCQWLSSSPMVKWARSTRLASKDKMTTPNRDAYKVAIKWLAPLKGPKLTMSGQELEGPILSRRRRTRRGQRSVRRSQMVSRAVARSPGQQWGSPRGPQYRRRRRDERPQSRVASGVREGMHKRIKKRRERRTITRLETNGYGRQW